MSEAASPLPPGSPVVTSPASGRVPTLDGLRGAAVLLVLAHHYVVLGPLLDAPYATPTAYVRAALLVPTAAGVDLFFVLSGFLVGGILLDYRQSARLLPTFYLRRFLRIVPLAWACITIVFVIGLVTGLRGLAGPAGWWPYYTFTTNFALAAHQNWWLSWLTPLWSVAVEEQFYLFLPLVVRFWPEQRLAWIAPALILTAWVSRTIVLASAPGQAFVCHMLMPCRLDAFGCGFAAAWLVRSRWWPAWRALGLRRWLLLAPPALACAYLCTQHRNPVALASWGYSAIAAFNALMLLLVYEPAHVWIKAVFSSRVLLTYGKYSYFVYLFQVMLVGPVLGTLFHGSWQASVPTNLAECALAFVLPLPLAWLSWRFFEEPLLAIGRRRTYT